MAGKFYFFVVALLIALERVSVGYMEELRLMLVGVMSSLKYLWEGIGGCQC